jgi:hypothetical protein
MTILHLIVIIIFSYLSTFKNNFSLYVIFGEGFLNEEEEFSKNSSPIRNLNLDS